jgi:BMFP domain-containing protein YqiC
MLLPMAAWRYKMQSENRIFDDLAKVINGMAGTVAGMGREAESNFKDRAREWAGGLNMVSREEFDAVKQMAAKAREEADALALRVAKLEAAMKPAAKAAGKAAPIKTASAPSATKTVAKRKASK